MKKEVCMIGYLKITDAAARIWTLFDASGQPIKAGSCYDCTTAAIEQGVVVMRIH